MKEQLQRAKQALEGEPAPMAADAAPADAGPAPVAGKAQQRAKKADDYHARHRSWVAEFNELTGGECAGGEAGVKWAAVRAWQQKHWQLNNLLADGLVGPKTLEAAKLLAKKSAPPKADKDGAGDGGGDGKAGEAGSDGKAKEAEAPQAGHADAAEASADKPNLDADVDVDEQLKPDAEAKPAAAGSKHTTRADFEAASKKLEAILAQFDAPKAEPGEKPVAQHYVEGTDDKDAPPALGAMMSKEVLVGYEAAAKQLAAQWDSLGRPHARAQLLLDAVNEALAAEKVPGISRVHLQKMPNPGEFESTKWVMNMNEATFSASKFKNREKDVDQIASQVFHEGRHAEQRFAIARLLASKQPPLSLDEIHAQANVPKEIAAKAIELRGEPMSSDQQKAAEAFKHATVDNPAHQEIEHQSALITDAANHAAEVLRALPPADQQAVAAHWQELRQRTIGALEAYYHLATERDAFAAQKQLAAANK